MSELLWVDSHITGRQADIRFGGINHHDSKDDWRTPPKLKNQVYETFNLNFDPCPYPQPNWDGLAIDWGERCFVNPPYGKNTSKWIEKALKEIKLGHTKIAVFLIHARTDTKWFHNLVLKHAKELLFIKGRLGFVSPTGKQESSPFPSLLAVFYAEPMATSLIVEAWIQ